MTVATTPINIKGTVRNVPHVVLNDAKVHLGRHPRKDRHGELRFFPACGQQSDVLPSKSSRELTCEKCHNIALQG